MDRNAPDQLPADAPFCPVHRPDFIPHPDQAEQAVSRVLWLSAVAMVVEIVTGYLSGSMALLSDGWHMGTHVAAMAISAFAYTYMRAHRGSARYSFGPGKVSYLAGYSSSLLLAGAALFMIVESVARLRTPHAIHYDEALLVALIGLAVNLLSAWLLHEKGGHAHHGHDHAHDHAHGGHHHHGTHDDHNPRAAYLHVVADALTSIAAIGALVAGKWAGLTWLDPLVAMLGGLIILRWAWQLARDSATVLLDRQVEGSVFDAVLGHVDEWGGRPLDIHLWLLAPGRHALALTVAGSPQRDPEGLRARLAGEKTLAHVTLDLRVIDDASGAAQQSI